MLRKNHVRAVAAVSLLIVSTFIFSTPAWARKDGVSGYSGRNTVICTACHAQLPPVGPVPPVIALPPTVTITGPTTVTAGSINSYVLTMTGGVPTIGTSGLDVAADGGQLIVTSPAETWLLNNEIAHKQTVFGPKQVDAAGTASWTFDWQAPASNGSYTLFGSALSGNGDFGFYGDSAAAATLVINVSGGALQPPTANAGGPYTGVIGTPVQFNGSGSFDGDGFVTAYSWNFGDGNTGTGPTPTHTYTAVGLYTVTLTVTDNDGLTGAATTTANIGTGTPPPPIIDGLALYNANCAGCHGTAPGAKAGRSATQIQNAINAVPAMMIPSLQALTAAEVQAIADAISGAPLPQPPTAVTGGPYTGTVGTAVQFNGAGSFDTDGTVVSYAWDFGDGGTASGSTPTHSYAASGTYTVTLTVTDNDGLQGTSATTATIGTGTPPPPPPIDGLALYNANCAGCHGAAPGAKAGRSATQIQNAINSVVAMMIPSLQALTAAEVQAIADAIAVGPQPQPPTAVSGGPYTGVIGTPVQFNGSGSFDGDGFVTAYSWNFGDGNTGTGPTPTHTYTAVGLYTVTLTVTDNDGLTGTATTTANIGTGTPPPPIIDGLALYNANCAGCHGAAPGAKAGRSATQIQNAINAVPAMMIPSLQALTAAEVQAIADAIAGGPPPTTGKELYDAYCLSCHGPEGKGGPEEKVTGASANKIQEAINNKKAMQYLKSLLNVDQIKLISDYLNGGGGGGTIPIGQQLYDTYCLACHGPGGKGGPEEKVTGASASKIKEAIDKKKAMQSLKGVLNDQQIKYISDYLNGKATPPAPPPPTDGLGLYNTYCAACHGAAPGAKAGRTAAQIQAAINSVGAMNTAALRALTATQIQAIADAIANGGSPPTTGRELYDAYCAACHGPEGKGGKEEDVRGASESKIKEAINKKREMQYLKPLLNSEQIKRIADYLR